ncbi:hypothetical protein Q4554_15465 [Leptospira santarosai]|uniref:hypothetical protein n=1 Tax=Leptospira santarosai TaxID=28183 RepID=UPI0026E28648|nr:hypothetical protein [Leptospira santarosai]MDO6395476.1 hypothetical protein [Leptospira santarosai]
MITEEELTDELIATTALEWRHIPGNGWLTRARTIEERLPQFLTDGRWTGLLWQITYPIIIDKMLQLRIQEDEITFQQYDLDAEDYFEVRESAPPSSCALSYPLTASTINSALCLIILNKNNL